MSHRASSLSASQCITTTTSSGKGSSSPSSLASGKRNNNKLTISNFYSNLHSPRRMNKSGVFKSIPVAITTGTNNNNNNGEGNYIKNDNNNKNNSTQTNNNIAIATHSKNISSSSLAIAAQKSTYQRRILSDFNVTAISSSTVTPSDYVINNPHVHISLRQHVMMLPQSASNQRVPGVLKVGKTKSYDDVDGTGGQSVENNRQKTGTDTTTSSPSSSAACAPHVKSTRTIDIQISSFSPLSRRVKADPQFIAIHAGIPTESEYEESLARKFDSDGEKENQDYTSVDATPLEPDSPYWIPIASLTCLPAVIRLPVTARHLRLSFHTTKPSRYIGEAIASIYSIIKAPNFVAPIKYKVTSKQAAAVIFLRCSNHSNANSIPNQSNKITGSKNAESPNTTAAAPTVTATTAQAASNGKKRGVVDMGVSIDRAGLSLVSRIGPSMIRESRNVCALALSIVVNKNHNDTIKKKYYDGSNNYSNSHIGNNGSTPHGKSHPIRKTRKEYSWPIGRVSIGRKLDRSGCISAPADVIWFGISDTEEDIVLKIQWMGAPKKGLTFVHGELFLQVNQLNDLKKGELFTITWVESTCSVPVNRSVQVEDLSLHNGYWFIDFSLTR